MVVRIHSQSVLDTQLYMHAFVKQAEAAKDGTLTLYLRAHSSATSSSAAIAWSRSSRVCAAEMQMRARPAAKIVDLIWQSATQSTCLYPTQQAEPLCTAGVHVRA